MTEKFLELPNSIYKLCWDDSKPSTRRRFFVGNTEDIEKREFKTLSGASVPVVTKCGKYLLYVKFGSYYLLKLMPSPGYHLFDDTKNFDPLTPPDFAIICVNSCASQVTISAKGLEPFEDEIDGPTRMAHIFADAHEEKACDVDHELVGQFYLSPCCTYAVYFTSETLTTIVPPGLKKDQKTLRNSATMKLQLFALCSPNTSVPVPLPASVTVEKGGRTEKIPLMCPGVPTWDPSYEIPANRKEKIWERVDAQNKISMKHNKYIDDVGAETLKTSNDVECACPCEHCRKCLHPVISPKRVLVKDLVEQKLAVPSEKPKCTHRHDVLCPCGDEEEMKKLGHVPSLCTHIDPSIKFRQIKQPYFDTSLRPTSFLVPMHDRDHKYSQNVRLLVYKKDDSIRVTIDSENYMKK